MCYAAPLGQILSINHKKTNLGHIVGKVFARVLDTADGDVQGKDLESANDNLDGSQPDEPSVRATANRNQRKRTRAPGLA